MSSFLNKKPFMLQYAKEILKTTQPTEAYSFRTPQSIVQAKVSFSLYPPDTPSHNTLTHQVCLSLPEIEEKLFLVQQGH